MIRDGGRGRPLAVGEAATLLDEQAALRRIAELSAQAVTADDVLAAVADEASRLSRADVAALVRFGADGSMDVGARTGAAADDAAVLVETAAQHLWRTHHAIRVDGLGGVTGGGAGARRIGAESIAVPIVTDGSLWGGLVVVHRHRLPTAGVEDRMGRFAGLVGTAIAAAEARLRLRALADEHTALRRMIGLLGRGAAPDEVCAALTDEASALLGGCPTALLSYDGDAAVVVAIRGSPAPSGLRVAAHDGTPTGQVRRTGRSLRVASFAVTALADLARELGVLSGVAVPIAVGDRVQAALVAGSAGPPLEAGIEARLAPLTDLAGVALADAEARARLTASRARIVADADESRRRLQRSVHDGAQQRLVHAVIALRMARGAVGTGSVAAGLVEEALTQVERAGHELRDVLHGSLPRSLTHGGLRLALESLLADLPLPVDARVTVPRLPAGVETTAFFAVAEVLANAVEHARAHRTALDVGLDGEVLVVEVRDDGVGGADPARGTGLTGLVDRVEAVGGSVTIVSPQGVGTSVHVELPTRPGADLLPAGGRTPRSSPGLPPVDPADGS